MRRQLPLLLPVLLVLIALPAVAAQTPEKPPAQLPGLQPIPEPPPMPAGASDEDIEPQVTITQRGQDKVEEYRANGKLYMIKVTPPHGVPYYLVDEHGDGVIKVTPPHGVPYYLVDEHGDGVMTRKDTLNSGTRPPMWVIKRW